MVPMYVIYNAEGNRRVLVNTGTQKVDDDR